MVEHLDCVNGRTTVEKAGIEQHILLHTYNVMMVHYVIEPNVESAYHNHPHEQMGYVFRGEAVQTVDGETHSVSPGTCYRIEPGEKHSMRAVGEEPLELIDVFHPVREDYLPEC